MKLFIRVFAYLRRYPLLAAGQLGCAVLSTVLVIVFPTVLREIIDHIIPHGKSPFLEKISFLTSYQGNPTSLLWLMAAICLFAYLLQELFDAGRIALNNHFEQRVIYELRSDLYGHIQKLPLRWFDHRRTGDIMTRIIEDVTAMERVLIDGIEMGIVALMQVLVVLLVLSLTNPLLTAIALIPLPFLIAGALTYTLTAKHRYRENRRAVSEMNSILHDNIAGVRQIKSYTREKEELQRFNHSSNLVKRSALRIMKAWAIYSPSMSFFTNAGRLAVVLFGGISVLHGAMELGNLIMFLFLVELLYEPTRRLHQMNQLLQAGRAAAERVFSILDEAPEPGLAGGDKKSPIAGGVEYRNVSFSYKEELPTLKDVSLHATRGETIALVGPTGAGKTTIINLLTRFYEYHEGQILVDGVELHQWNQKHLRQAMGYVTQEPFLFNGSIRDNLTIARKNLTEKDLWSALQAAYAEQFVRSLPQGLDTNVGERGIQLSGGEKQRISIARALLKNPPILLLDEATASVDSETEKMIQKALHNLLQNRTSFVIAHRLSTIREAHRIYVLDEGRIVEWGTHEQLLENDGLYAHLSQSAFL